MMRNRAIGLLLILGWMVLPAHATEAPRGESGRTSLANTSVKYVVPEKPYLTLKRGDTEAVVVDNSAVDDAVLPGHRSGYSGLASLKHKQSRNLFVPAYAGLNFEHIHDGTVRPREVLFEPRQATMELRRIDEHTAELYQKPTPTWGLESCHRYRLLEDGTIELTFECIARKGAFRNGYIGLFWASYINRPESLDIHFRGHAEGDSTPVWVRGVSRSHGSEAMHPASDDQRSFPHDAAFPLTLVFNRSRWVYSQSWYYGVFHDLAFLQVFRPSDGIRFSQSPSGGGEGNPAWDFQWFIPQYEVGRLYRTVMRARLMPLESPAAVEAAAKEHQEAMQEARPTGLRVSPSGHYFRHGDRTIFLLGDSGTQVVLMNPNLDYRAWIDQCQREGHSTIHIWSFTGIRKGDWRLGDGAALQPWKRDAEGKFSLLEFDEGEDPARHYWPRLRGICRYARERGLLVGITVFHGWAKGGGPSPGLRNHPFHQLNGGFCQSETEILALAAPEREIHGDAWDPTWPAARKSQWVWERFALKLIEVANQTGNVWFDYRDEWSYANAPAAAAEPHWRRFFLSRSQTWADRSSEASFRVANPQVPPFGATPTMKTEGEPYEHDAVRREVWSRACSGIHYVLHNDAREPNIAAWDVSIARAKKLDPREDLGRRYVGHCSRFFNEHVQSLDRMVPAQNLVSGNARCLAAVGVEYAVYIPARQEAVSVDLGSTEAEARFYDVREGRFLEPQPITTGGRVTLRTPDAALDWALLIRAVPAAAKRSAP